MMRFFLSFLTLTLLVSSCRRHDCFDLPNPTVFEFINADGQNLVADGMLVLSSTLIMEDIGDTLFKSVQYNVTSDSKIMVKELGWYDGNRKYRFSSDTTFYFVVYSSKNPSSGCDNAFKIDSLRFTNITASKKADFYQVIIR